MENTNVTEQSTNEIMPMAASGETNFASLTEKTTPASGDMFLMEDSEDTKKINYDKLADAILNKLTSKTYSGLETTAKNFVTAINELNSKSQLNALQSGDLLEFAKSCNRGMTIFRTNNNVINTPAEYCEGYIISADNNVSIMAHDMTSLNIYANQKSNKGDFVGWKKISLE